MEPRTFRRGGKLHYKSLARQAADFRDNLWKACAAVARERTVKNTFYRQIEERAKLADELPEIAPFDDAVKLITREATKKQPRKKRARENFLTFLLGIRGIVRRFALPTGLVGLPVTFFGAIRLRSRGRRGRSTPPLVGNPIVISPTFRWRGMSKST